MSSLSKFSACSYKVLVCMYLVMVHENQPLLLYILKSNDCGSYSGFSDHRSKQENGAVHSVEMKPLKDVYLGTQKSSEDSTVSCNHCKFDSPKQDDVSYAFYILEISSFMCILTNPQIYATIEIFFLLVNTLFSNIT
jgi:hypothetical protein